MLMTTVIAVSMLMLASSAQAFSLQISPKILNNWTTVTGQVLPQVLGEKLYSLVDPVPPMDQQPMIDQQRPQEYQGQPMNQGNQPSCPYFDFCAGKVVRKDFNGVMCDVCDSGAQQNYQQKGQPCDGQNCPGQPNNQQQRPEMMQGPQGPNSQGGGQGPDQEGRQLKEMQRGAGQMINNLNRLERNFASAEKKGITVSQDIKNKLASVKEILAKITSASDGASLQDIDLGALNQDLADLEQTWNEQMQQAQQLQNVKRDIKNLTNGIKMFESRIKSLEKQKIVVPAEVKDTIAKIKTIITAVTAAKTWAEVEAAGFEDTQDLMESLREHQQLMDMLSRWPQTLKQLNNELKNLNTALKRDTATVKRLSAKGVDLSSELADFKNAIAKLTAVRDAAVVKIKAGTVDDIDAVFTDLQDNFFDQMEEIWALDKTINIMGNLTQFQAQSKKELATAQATITKLKKQQKDTSGMEEILALTKTKVAEIQALAKAKPLDTEAVLSGLDELNSLRGEFADAYSELTGEENDMPWEGPGQFKDIQMNFKPDNYMPSPAQTQPMP